MRTYNKEQDFKNRLKFAVILIALFSLWFLSSSCSKEEDPDFIPGQWEYSNDDFKVEFEIERRGNTYFASNIKINGAEEWKLFQVNEVDPGRKIGYIGIKSLDDTNGIAFINSILAQGNNEILSDTVAYVSGGNQNVKYYFNQVLKKK